MKIVLWHDDDLFEIETIEDLINLESVFKDAEVYETDLVPHTLAEMWSFDQWCWNSLNLYGENNPITELEEAYGPDFDRSCREKGLGRYVKSDRKADYQKIFEELCCADEG